jgi:hypothetical protein
VAGEKADTLTYLLEDGFDRLVRILATGAHQHIEALTLLVEPYLDLVDLLVD